MAYHPEKRWLKQQELAEAKENYKFPDDLRLRDRPYNIKVDKRIKMFEGQESFSHRLKRLAEGYSVFHQKSNRVDMWSNRTECKYQSIKADESKELCETVYVGDEYCRTCTYHVSVEKFEDTENTRSFITHCKCPVWDENFG